MKIHQTELVELLSTPSLKPSFELRGHYEQELLHDLQVVNGTLSSSEPLSIQTQSEGTSVQLHIVLAGTSHIGTGKKSFIFQKQEQHLLQHTNVEGFLQLPGKQEYRFIEINLGQAFLDRMLAYGDQRIEALFMAKKQEMVVSLSKLNATGHPIISGIIQDIVHNPFQGALRALYLESRATELLVWQAAGVQRPTIDTRISLKDQDKLYHARELIQQNLRVPYPLSKLASMVGMSESSLKRGFKAAFGNTVFGYLHELRMDQARILLHDHRHSVAEVAYLAGYQHSQHFSSAFKRRFGYSPSEK